MSTKTVLFVNLPWYEKEFINDGQFYLRRGVRAGSRWPFTIRSSYMPDQFQLGTYIPYPYFMGSAAGWVQAMVPDAKVIVRDSIARGESYASFDRFWQSTQPTHVIVETSAASWEHDKRYIVAMRQSIPSVKIAVAGPTVQQSYSGSAGPDAWILGEYEKGAAKFVGGEIGLIGYSFLTKEEMHHQPFPMFDEGVWHHYFDSNPIGSAMPELTVWGSRGCPWKCSFCSFPATMTNNDPLGKGPRKIRFYDPVWLYSYILHRKKIAEQNDTPLRTVRFDGDTENASDSHVEAICDVMKRIGLPWSMMCRADTLKDETWGKMKEAGCFGIKVGFESASPRVVNEVIGKKLDIAAAARTCQHIQNLGIKVHGTFTQGLPSETKEEVQMTHDFIKNLYEMGAISTHQLSGTAELPGTPLATRKQEDANYLPSNDGQRKIEEMQK